MAETKDGEGDGTTEKRGVVDRDRSPALADSLEKTAEVAARKGEPRKAPAGDR